jgi:hypothetical protein
LDEGEGVGGSSSMPFSQPRDPADRAPRRPILSGEATVA